MINPDITITKMNNVAIVAKMNFNLLVKKSRTGLPISVRIKATIKYTNTDEIW
jgi:hypothetical protein